MQNTGRKAYCTYFLDFIQIKLYFFVIKLEINQLNCIIHCKPSQFWKDIHSTVSILTQCDRFDINADNLNQIVMYRCTGTPFPCINPTPHLLRPLPVMIRYPLLTLYGRISCSLLMHKALLRNATKCYCSISTNSIKAFSAYHHKSSKRNSNLGIGEEAAVRPANLMLQVSLKC